MTHIMRVHIDTVPLRAKRSQFRQNLAQRNLLHHIGLRSCPAHPASKKQTQFYPGLDPGPQQPPNGTDKHGYQRNPCMQNKANLEDPDQSGDTLPKLTRCRPERVQRVEGSPLRPWTTVQNKPNVDIGNMATAHLRIYSSTHPHSGPAFRALRASRDSI